MTPFGRTFDADYVVSGHRGDCGLRRCARDRRRTGAIAQTAKGKTFVDAHGMTLYAFAKDSDGKSTCKDACAKNWPPLAAGRSAAEKGEKGWPVVREDGSKQWAYRGKPLYTFVKDEKPGDLKGDGFLNGAWSVAQP